MSDTGGKFQSMNPKAPIQEVMPGVSLVKGNQGNDNVPIKIPDGETKVFSKRLGYADKGLELIEQYKQLESSPDPADFIGQQTKKFQLKKIKQQLEKLFKEQESSKSKQIAKRTGSANIPKAGLGDLFQKGKDFFGNNKDTFKNIGNFALENSDILYNLGMGAFSKDPQLYSAGDYFPDYNPNPDFGKIDKAGILSTLGSEVDTARYNIMKSGGSPE